ncbi:MAG: hypothetical protein ABJK59_10025 [Erythrobacter sp.]|uniref:hypothetical protein n=1 Tax=Erythrobacter sp. TaxID=1042 RepID=UPI00329754F1
MSNMRLLKAALTVCLSVPLSGCHILFPDDPREGLTGVAGLFGPATQFAHAFNPTIGEDR